MRTKKFLMINEDVAGKIIQLGESSGASFVEVRLEEDEEESARLKNGEVDAIGYSNASGAGIRVVYGGALGFSSTNDLSDSKLRDALGSALSMAKAASKSVKKPISFARGGKSNAKWSSAFKEDPFSIPLEEKVSLLLDLEKSLPKIEASFPARIFAIGFNRKNKIIQNSYGEGVSGKVLTAEGFIFLTAYSPQKGTAQKYDQLGAAEGWEAVKEWDLSSRLSNMAKALSENLMRGVEPSTGIKDVVLGSEVTGIVVHESAGHPAEADRIMGREAAQAGESYLKIDSIGYNVGSKKVTVIDDPTIPKSYGFYLYDDEGIAAKPRYLIKDGKINEFLHNRETAAALGISSNGASRASSFDREPMVRMANTYFAPGDQEFEELIEDIKEGIYIKSFMEWNIDDKRWNERYVGLEAFSIVNGKIQEPVRGPVLEITTEKLYSSVDAVSKNLSFNAATCGKGEPQQGVPVWTGGPEIRLRSVRISKR